MKKDYLCILEAMKKSILIVSVILLKMSAFAQSAYMHEAQEDAREGGGDFFTAILGFVVLIVFAKIISSISKSVKKEHERKMEKRKRNEKKTDDILTNMDDIINSIQKKQ